MWTRKELKKKGKAAFMLNYWKTVFVSLILVVLVGGAAGSFAGAGRRGTDTQSGSAVESTMNQSDPVAEAVDEFSETVSDFSVPAGGVAVITIFAIVLFLLIFSVSLAVNVFVLNPLMVGCYRFFTRNLNQKAGISEITFAFDHNYLNNVKTTFLKDLYTILWSLLFIIPGIIKAYEYRMIPYILADHPEMTTKEVFAKSKELMKGQKWNAFVLDLSFIGWEILSLLTVRILGILYVSPYRSMTNAALYERLEYGNLVEENN